MEMDPNKSLFSTRVSCGAAYGVATVAENGYFNEWCCLQQGQRRRQRLVQRLRLPLPAVAASSTHSVYSFNSINYCLCRKGRYKECIFGANGELYIKLWNVKNDFAKNIPKACVVLHVWKR